MECVGVEGVLGHLMFHKAMIDEDNRSLKIDHYLTVLEHTGGNANSHDPLDRSIETVFELVLSNSLDPWDIDLMQFTTLYASKVKDENVNFVLAGKLMLMAWSILRLQSERVLSNSEDRQSFYSDWDFDSLDAFYPRRDQPKLATMLPDEIELSEVVRHHGSRPVTLVELLDAFEEAKREEGELLIREKLRQERRAKLDAAFDTKAHNDDMERDVEDVWQRIIKCGSGAVDFNDLCNGGREDIVTIIMSLLFLARAGKISIWQDDMPYGKIYLEVKMAWDIGTLEDVPVIPVPTPVPADREAVM
jgi:segregation and condensation protein A